MVKIAILGFGTVGSGVWEVVEKNRRTIMEKTADEISIKYILDIRDFTGEPWADRVIHDFSIIENDPEVRIVVETIGGARAAYDFTKRALLAGKNVVTSNKELVALHGVELIGIAKERNLNYLFEASVGGGIPIIRPLTQCLSANDLNSITGILNGTTNYILTRMVRAGLSFSDALAEAQALGYAEANPSADVDGIDACRKICILSNLAFGRHIDPDCVPTEGIRGVALADVEYARACGHVIRLIGRALRRDDGRVNVLVAPHLVSRDCPLSNVEDVFNGIMVDGNAIGEVMFYGRGAGKLPTASAVVADVIDAVKHFNARKYIGWEPAEPGFLADAGDMPYSFYVRAACTPEQARRHFGAVTLLPPHDDGAECAFLTPVLETRDAQERLMALRGEGCDALAFIRVLK